MPPIIEMYDGKYHAVTCPSSQEEKDSEETEIEVAETEATEAS
jgi:hypothetical protein